MTTATPVENGVWRLRQQGSCGVLVVVDECGAIVGIVSTGPLSEHLRLVVWGHVTVMETAPLQLVTGRRKISR